MVFTNEPGIYIRADALDNLPDTPENRTFIEKVRPAFEKYKNIGVRIEDDILVTESGAEWMTKALPRTIADIEAFMGSAPKTVSIDVNRPTPVNVFLDQAVATLTKQPAWFLTNPESPLVGQTHRSGFRHTH
jgi:hypothetical protein